MMRPGMKDNPALIFPRARKWIGNTISEQTKDVSDIQNAFSLLRVSDVEDIKKEFPIAERFLMQQTIPDEVATALARIHELFQSSNPKQGSPEPQELVALDPPAEPAHKQATTGTLHDAETEAPMDVRCS
ncbi:hypothetical protein ACP70R_005760 [Stipagrostis hirtigluma subsp. patula]